MPCIDQTDATALLAAILNATPYTTVASTNLRLGVTAPTATANMTELSSSGYTPGGQVITWNTVLAAATSNSGAVSWTNGSGGSWSLVGLEVWDTTPARHLYGTWTGQPVNVSAGNTFQVASAGISVALS